MRRINRMKREQTWFVGMMAVLLTTFFLITGCQNTAVTSAKVYMQQNNYDKAIEQCNIAISQNPNDAEAYFVLGKAYGTKGMYREMKDAFDKSLAISNSRAADIQSLKNRYWRELFNSGVSSYRQDQLDKAVDKFLLAIELIPDSTASYKNLGIVYSQMDKDSMAVQTYLKAIEIDPEDIKMKTVLGSLYYKNGEYENAIDIFQKVVEKADPNSKEYVDAMISMAFSYDFLGESDKAKNTYLSALEKVPNNKDIIFNLGRLNFMQKNYEEAIENFKKVLEADPEDFESYLNIGNAYLQLEKFKESIPFYQKAIEFKPDNANAWNNLGVAYVRAGDTEKGKEAFDKAESLRGE
jgi:tetratricopeptide (TPR) repeat protein